MLINKVNFNTSYQAPPVGMRRTCPLQGIKKDTFTPSFKGEEKEQTVGELLLEYSQRMLSINNDLIGFPENKFKERILTFLTDMTYENPESHRNLEMSNAYRAMKKGDLNIELLEGADPKTKDWDFYVKKKLDEYDKDIENELKSFPPQERDLIKNIAEIDTTQEAYTFDDIKSCKNPKALMTVLKAIDNELSAKEESLYPREKVRTKKAQLDLVSLASKNPETAEKLVSLDGFDSKKVLNLLNTIKTDDEKKILDRFAAKSKTYPEVYYVDSLSTMISFSKATNPTIIEQTLDFGEENPVFGKNLDYFPTRITENNYEFFKNNLKNKTFDKAQIYMLAMTSEMPDAKEIFADKEKTAEFEKTFEHLAEITNAKDLKDMIHLKFFLELKYTDNNKFEKIMESGIIDLISQGKVDMGILYKLNANSDFSENIYSDIEKVKNNESIVPEFTKNTPESKILKETKQGDAISVDGQMFINHGEKLIKWKMTKDKYIELFPPIKRFSNRQDLLGDCYFINSVDNMMNNPKSRIRLYKMFRQDGNDVYVNIPSLKQYCGEVKFKNSEITLPKNSKHVKGAKGFQMLEQTYAKTALRNRDEDKTPISASTPLEVEMDRITTGAATTAYRQLLNNEKQTLLIKNNKNSLLMRDTIKKNANDPNILMSVGTIPSGTNESTLNERYGLYSSHAYAVKGFDEESCSVFITNPHNTGVTTKIPLTLLIKNIDSIYMSEIS